MMNEFFCVCICMPTDRKVYFSKRSLISCMYSPGNLRFPLWLFWRHFCLFFHNFYHKFHLKIENDYSTNQSFLLFLFFSDVTYLIIFILFFNFQLSPFLSPFLFSCQLISLDPGFLLSSITIFSVVFHCCNNSFHTFFRTFFFLRGCLFPVRPLLLLVPILIRKTIFPKLSSK